MELSKYDELVVLESIIKTASERRDMLKYECKDELLEAYERDGTTQKRSKLFGKDASVMSVTFSKPKEAQEVEEWNMDYDAFNEWVGAFVDDESNRKAVKDFIFAKGELFGQYWLRATGELPDGINRVTYMTDPVPEKVTGTRLSVKPEKVFDALGISFEEGIRGLLPGDVE